MSALPFFVKMKKATLTYQNTTAKKLFTLPRNSHVLFFLADVDDAFNDSGTDLVDLGIVSDPDYFANDVDVSAAGQVMIQQFALGDIGSRPVEVYGTYAGQNSNATAGKAVICCVYADPFNH